MDFVLEMRPVTLYCSSQFTNRMVSNFLPLLTLGSMFRTTDVQDLRIKYERKIHKSISEATQSVFFTVRSHHSYNVGFSLFKPWYKIGSLGIPCGAQSGRFLIARANMSEARHKQTLPKAGLHYSNGEWWEAVSLQGRSK